MSAPDHVPDAGKKVTGRSPSYDAGYARGRAGEDATGAMARASGSEAQWFRGWVDGACERYLALNFPDGVLS